MNMQVVRDMLQEYEKGNDWERTYKASILLYTYADRLMQMSLYQKKEEDKRLRAEALEMSYEGFKTYKKKG